MERNTWQDRAKAQREEGCCVMVTPSPSRRFLGERQIPVGSVIGHPSAQRQHPTAPGRGAQPHLAQGAGGDDVVLELHGQAPAQLDGLHVALARAGERGEQEAHGQGIVQVPQGVDECGVPAARGAQGGSQPAPESCKSCWGWGRLRVRKEWELWSVHLHIPAKLGRGRWTILI